jgi:acyl-CoA thioesterase I
MMGLLKRLSHNMAGHDWKEQERSVTLQKSIERLQTGKPIRIIALGDSLTQGWMARKGYLDYLSEMLKKKYPESRPSIVNRGIPGDTAEGGLYRLRGDVLDLDPDLVFLQFALNDAFTGVNPEVFKNTISAMISQIRSDTDAEILLLTSVPIMHGEEDFMAEKFYSRLIAISEEEKVPIVQVHQYWKKRIAGGVDFRSLIQFDLVHPNAEGYRLMAEAIMEMF